MPELSHWHLSYRLLYLYYLFIVRHFEVFLIKKKIKELTTYLIIVLNKGESTDIGHLF